MKFSRIFRGLANQSQATVAVGLGAASPAPALLPSSSGLQGGQQLVELADQIFPVVELPGRNDLAQRLIVENFVGSAGAAFVNGPLATGDEVLYVLSAQAFHSDAANPHSLGFYIRQNNTTLTCLAPSANTMFAVATPWIFSIGQPILIPPGFLLRGGVVDTNAFAAGAQITMNVLYCRCGFSEPTPAF